MNTPIPSSRPGVWFSGSKVPPFFFLLGRQFSCRPAGRQAGSPLMGDRFTVIYRITGTEPDALSTAKEICLEQTVEMPEELLAQVLDKPVADWMRGWLDHFEAVAPDLFEARISYPIEATAFEL